MTAGAPSLPGVTARRRDGAGLNPVRTRLSNGVRVLVKETRKTPAVSLNLAMDVGSADDPVGAGGLVYLLARVIDRGTATRSADDIAEVLENRGISLSVSVSRHQFSLICTALADDFEMVLTLLSEMLIAPALPDHEIATRKGEVITAIRQDEDSPAVRAVEGLLGLLFGPGHPYGRRTKGSAESVEALTRSALLDLHVSRFAPSALSIVIAGDVDETRAVDAAARAFHGWAAAGGQPAPIPAAPAPVPRRQLVVTIPGKAQSDVAYGFTGIRRSDPAYYAYWLMNNALGQYAMGGRLGASIRERQGMAYSVGSSLDAMLGEGPLMVRAGVAPANVERAIASIDAEMQALIDEGLTERELQESRQYLIGSMPRALETNTGIANFLQNAEFYGLGLDYDRRLPDLLNVVTLEDVLLAARRTIHPDRAAVVIAGPGEP